MRRFRISDRAAAAIAHIVHDVDLHDDRYRDPRADTIAALVEGLRAAHTDDLELLQHGIAMFEALYRSMSGSVPRRRTRRVSPRPRRRS